VKTKIFLSVALLVALAAFAWHIQSPLTAPATATSPGARKILYYQSSMHPWIKSDKPGKCPICGMDLVPVYASDTDLAPAGGIHLKSDSVTVLNVQSVAVARRPIVRTLRVAGLLSLTSRTNGWFEFDAYERDLPWLKAGQSVEITASGMPGKTFVAEIKLPAAAPAGGQNFDPASGSTKLRAEITRAAAPSDDSDPPIPFSGLYAEGLVRTETPEVLAVPRSAVLSPDAQPVVYMDEAGGRYEPRKVTLGRIGDEYAEVLAGLRKGEKVVTTGNLLIDAETQISQSAN